MKKLVEYLGSICLNDLTIFSDRLGELKKNFTIEPLFTFDKKLIENRKDDRKKGKECWSSFQVEESNKRLWFSLWL